MVFQVQQPAGQSLLKSPLTLQGSGGRHPPRLLGPPRAASGSLQFTLQGSSWAAFPAWGRPRLSWRHPLPCVSELVKACFDGGKLRVLRIKLHVLIFKGGTTGGGTSMFAFSKNIQHFLWLLHTGGNVRPLLAFVQRCGSLEDGTKLPGGGGKAS